MNNKEKAKSIDDVLQKDEMILWQYKPSSLSCWIAALKKFFFNNEKEKIYKFLESLITLIAITYFILAITLNPLEGLLFLIFVLGFITLIFLIPMFVIILLLSNENKNVSYYITNKRIIIFGDYETLTSTIKSIKNITFSDISRIFKNGTIEFILNGKPRMRFEGIPKVINEYSSIRLLVESLQKGTIK